MANKKVSQLSSKPSVLVTDLFPIADPSTGQLYKTTISDLGTAIGSGVSSVNGLVGAVVLDTDDIQELVSPTNKWFTDTRARAALSASSPLAYNSGTGVFSIPAATSSQNGYLTSTDWTTFNNKLSTATAASTYVPYTGATGNVNLGNNDITAGSFTGGTASFATSGAGAAVGINHSSGAGIALNISKSGSGEGIYVNKTSGTGNAVTIIGTLNATTIVKSGGTSSQFLKADGSVDSTAYLPLAGGTLTGALFGASASFSGFVGFGGNTSPLAAIDVTGAGRFSSTISAAGATLTGALSGTSATFSGAVQGVQGNFYQSSTSGFAINLRNRNANQTWGLVVDTDAVDDKNLGFYSTHGTAYALKLASTGAATFSSSVTATLMGVGISSLSSWGSPFSVTQYPYGSYVGGTTSGAWVGGNNNYYDGSTYRYVVSDYATLVTQGGGDFYIRTATTGTAGNAITWNERFRVTNAGNVGIGTTAPQERFEVAGLNGNIRIYGRSGISSNSISSNLYYNGSAWVRDNSSFGAAQIAFNSSNDSIIFRTTASTSGDAEERMRITSGGDLLIGTTTDNSQRIRVDWAGGAGKWGIKMNASDGGAANLIEFLTGGSVRGSITTNGTTTAYNITSDYRLKEDLQPINGLEIVNKIKVYDYKWKASDSRMDGVLAHELAEVLPYAVTGVKDGEQMQQVDYSKIVPVMVQAIKELKAELDTLKNK